MELQNIGILNKQKFIFIENFDKTLTPNIIEEFVSRNVKKIEFGKYFNKSIDNLPDSIEEIILGDNFDKSIRRFPLSLVKLTINSRRVKKIALVPVGVREMLVWREVLNLGSLVNLEKLELIDFHPTILPPNLRTFIYHPRGQRYFDFTILPTTLEYLKLMDNFNQDITFLPNSVTTFEINSQVFSSQLNIKNCNLKTLTIGGSYLQDNGQPNLNFNQPLNELPNTLETLTIMECHEFNQPLNHLPDNLQNLKLIGTAKFNQHLNKLPINLKYLLIEGSKRFDEEYDYEEYDEDCGVDFNKSLDRLPEGLEKLVLKDLEFFSHSLDNLPVNLKKLYIKNTNIKLVNNLPINLKKLELIGTKVRNFDRLPEGLEKLVIIQDFNKPIDSLPRGLKYLKLVSDKFNQELNNLPNIVELNLYCPIFKKGIDNLPFSLETLEITAHEKLQYNNLPTNLKNLKIKSIYENLIVPPSVTNLNLHW